MCVGGGQGQQEEGRALRAESPAGWAGCPGPTGMRSRTVPRLQVAGDLVRRLHLEAHVDKPVATYSGGTKRKLSTALALLGRPDLLLLVSRGDPSGLRGSSDKMLLTSQSPSGKEIQIGSVGCLH